MSDYEATIRAVLSIPFVKELKRENKHLRKELKALKNLIYSLPEFRRDNVSTQPVQRTQVKIKKEPGQEDDDVVILDSPKNPTVPKENIVYVIDDTPSETESQAEEDAQASEEDAQAGEEQANEAEAQAGEAEASEEEEEQVSEAEEEEAEASEEEQVEEEDSGEVFEITIAGKSYYTTNEKNGKIYAIDADEEVGDEIGAFKDGKPIFNKTKTPAK